MTEQRLKHFNRPLTHFSITDSIGSLCLGHPVYSGVNTVLQDDPSSLSAPFCTPGKMFSSMMINVPSLDLAST